MIPSCESSLPLLLHSSVISTYLKQWEMELCPCIDMGNYFTAHDVRDIMEAGVRMLRMTGLKGGEDGSLFTSTVEETRDKCFFRA